MKRITTTIVSLLLMSSSCFYATAQVYEKQIKIVPLPQKYMQGVDSFTINNKTVLYVQNESQHAAVETLLSCISLKKKSGSPKKNVNNTIEFKENRSLPHEAYSLQITKDNVIIEASDKAGFLYGVQSLRQLLVTSANVNDVTKTYKLPVLQIEDAPRFEYRGVMLDVSRCFIPKENVKKIIDAAALLKLNKLHLHLVDDNGWRLEIKKYPKLTDVGAWRVEREGFFPERTAPQKGEATPVGGFYTQEDMAELIRYASERAIEIIPEIEMPAHTTSSLAAYPNLACPVVEEYIGVLPGFAGNTDGLVYCAGNEDVFTMLEGVIDEVATLFPSSYIHLGGDEASKVLWKKCPKCQARMKAENIEHEEELQSYFMKRMSKYVQSKGKQVLGWDELTNSTIPEGATIMGWQGMGNAGYKAGKLGHKFIMTPARVMYLIRYQGPQWFEPRTYFGNNTLKDVYMYEPIQASWDKDVAKNLIGVQASLWTEFCSSAEDVEYLLFPRLIGAAEVAWSDANTKDWNGFVTRLDGVNNQIQQLGIISATSMYNIDHKVEPNQNNLKVTLFCIRPDVQIYYTTNGNEPTVADSLYTDPFCVEKEQIVKAVTYKEGEVVGKVLSLSLSKNKATGMKVFSSNPNAYVLTNGLRGSNKHSDFEWCGWYGEDASFVVDLGAVMPINRVVLGTILNHGMGVHRPAKIVVSVSNDNENYAVVATDGAGDNTTQEQGIAIKDHEFKNLNKQARYVKFSLSTPGVCYPKHVRAGQKTWMHCDEVIIE